MGASEFPDGAASSERAAAGGLSDHRFITQGSALAVVAVTLAGLLSTLSSPALSRDRLALIFVLSVLHALLGTVGLARLERKGERRLLLPYFALALAIALGAVALSGGRGYLHLMSIVSQSVLYLPASGVTLVVGACSAVTLGLRAQSAPDELTLLKDIASFGAITAFVIVFSRMMLDQHRARAEVERLAGELRLANLRLQGYAANVEELATIQERNRLAREIHDGLGHYLTVVHVKLEAALVMLGSDSTKARSAVIKAQELTREGLSEIRRSVAFLRSSDRALVASIRTLADQCTAQGIAAELRLSGTERRLAVSTEQALFRTAQEALTNVRRHAGATRLTIDLAFTADDRVKLSVADDGVGTDGPEHGFGLLGLTERAALVGGTLSIQSARGCGFKLELEVPG